MQGLCLWGQFAAHGGTAARELGRAFPLWEGYLGGETEIKQVKNSMGSLWSETAEWGDLLGRS